MHTQPLMLAEDFSGLYTIFAIIFLTPFVGSVLGIAFAKRWPKFALVFGWIGVVVGALLLLMLAMTQGGALPAFWVTSALPLVAGIICLARWRRYRL